MYKPRIHTEIDNKRAPFRVNTLLKRHQGFRLCVAPICPHDGILFHKVCRVDSLTLKPCAECLKSPRRFDMWLEFGIFFTASQSDGVEWSILLIVNRLYFFCVECILYHV